MDSILVFWLTAGLLVFIKIYFDTSENKNFNYFTLSVCIIGGVMTKGIAGIFFVPAMFIISLIYKRSIFRDRSFYISIISVILICSAYYIFRDYYSPGYLELIWDTEILRYGKVVMSWQIQPFDYYFQNLVNYRFVPFIYFLPLLFVNYIITNRERKILISCLVISIVSYFLLISIPRVKLEWYDAPLFPLLAILTGLSFMETGKFLINKIFKKWNSTMQELLLFTVAIAFLIHPYNVILKNTAIPENYIYPLEAEGAYLKHLNTSNPSIKNITIFKQEKHVECMTRFYFTNGHKSIKKI